jgi:hypothetical protein
VRVQETQDHIDRGRPGKMCDCPIALAVKELTGSESVIVTWCGITTADQNCDIPIAAKNFIKLFDLGEKVQPFDFEIDLVPRTVITTEAQRLRIDPDAPDNDPQGP